MDKMLYKHESMMESQNRFHNDTDSPCTVTVAGALIPLGIHEIGLISRLETEQAALVVDTGTERKWPSQAIMSPFNSPSNVEKKYCAQKSRPNQITKLKLPSCKENSRRGHFSLCDKIAQEGLKV